MNARARTSEAELRELALRVLRIQQRAQARVVNLSGNADERVNAQSLRKNLSLPEIAIVYRSTGVREKGLASARAGDLVTGARLIGQARDLFHAAALCQEALAFLESFQWAAEAYMQYKERQYAPARASLLSALQACHVLRDVFGYHVEARRIHLARNIVRVETFANHQQEAMRLASCLEAYVEGCQERWPFPEFPVATAPDPLEEEVRWLLMDQILGEIALLWTRRNPRCREHVTLTRELLLAGGETGGELARVRTWLAALHASAKDDLKGFLDHALLFFSEQPGPFGNAWRELSLELFEVARNKLPLPVDRAPGVFP
jgi:hypothetical protein